MHTDGFDTMDQCSKFEINLMRTLRKNLLNQKSEKVETQNHALYMALHSLTYIFIYLLGILRCTDKYKGGLINAGKINNVN